MRQSTSAPATPPILTEARRLLRKRTRRLHQQMRRCARDAGDPERVHQLRIATRRIDAVLRLFAPFYAERPLKRTRRKIRRLRRAAREVRDLDVLLDRLPRIRPSDLDLSAVTAELRIRRDNAASDLEWALRKRRRKRLLSRLKRLSLTCSRPGDRSCASVEDLLRPCIAGFQSAASAELSDTTNLHQFRLQGKRLRYTLELVAGHSDTWGSPAFLALLKDLQQQLGDINDHVSAAAALQAISDDSTDDAVPPLARLLADQELHRLDAVKAAFLERWEATGREQTRSALEWMSINLTVPDVDGESGHAAE